MKSPTSPRSFAPTQLALVTEHRNIKQEVSSAPSSRFVSVFLKLFFSPSPCNGNRCKIRRPNPKDLPLVVFAREFSGLAVLTGFDDATLNSLFWIRANYHRPVDLTDTTGLCWREGILRCLESVRPLIQNLSIVKPAGRSTVKDVDRSEVKPAGTLKSSGRSAVSSKPAGQRGLLFTSSAQRGLLFPCPAQRGLLFQVQPREGSCSYVQPREGSCSRVQPREGSCSPVRPREGRCSYVWPTEGLRTRNCPQGIFWGAIGLRRRGRAECRGRGQGHGSLSCLLPGPLGSLLCHGSLYCLLRHGLLSSLLRTVAVGTCDKSMSGSHFKREKITLFYHHLIMGFKTNFLFIIALPQCIQAVYLFIYLWDSHYSQWWVSLKGLWNAFLFLFYVLRCVYNCTFSSKTVII